MPKKKNNITKIPKLTESQIQVSFFKWCEVMQNQKGFEPLRLIFKIPNEARRSWWLARKMKSEGLKSGVPDVFLPYPAKFHLDYSHDYVYKHGLFLEFKSQIGKLSDNQIIWITKLEEAGYSCHVVRSSDQAKEIVCSYLAGNLIK